MNKTDGPVPDWTIPVRLTADEWDLVVNLLQDRPDLGSDRIIAKIVEQTVTEQTVTEMIP